LKYWPWVLTMMATSEICLIWGHLCFMTHLIIHYIQYKVSLDSKRILNYKATNKWNNSIIWYSTFENINLIEMFMLAWFYDCALFCYDVIVEVLTTFFVPPQQSCGGHTGIGLSVCPSLCRFNGFLSLECYPCHLESPYGLPMGGRCEVKRSKVKCTGHWSRITVSSL
jgi:hypothetical protein